MRKQKFSVKLITLLMACLVTMTSVPVHIASSEVDGGQSIAADASTDNVNIDIDNQSGTGEYTDTDVFIVEEDVSKRGEFEKHYLCSDGTYNGTRAMLELFLNFYNTDLADLAEEFHDSLYINDYHVTELVNTYYLVGNGIKTIDQVVLRGSIWNDYSEEDNTIGDSVVPIWSATLGNRQLCRTIFKNVDHMGLISDQDCLDVISYLISGDLLIPEVL